MQESYLANLLYRYMVVNRVSAIFGRLGGGTLTKIMNHRQNSNYHTQRDIVATSAFKQSKMTIREEIHHWVNKETVLLVSDLTVFSRTYEQIDHPSIKRPWDFERYTQKRRAEFLAGRALVQVAQQRLDLPQLPIMKGRKGAPIWPSGQKGSISHSDDKVACLVSRNDTVLLGVDIERLIAQKSIDAVIDEAFVQEEHSYLRETRTYNCQQLVTLLFSAKETLFKALYPETQRFFGFEAARVFGTPEDGEICMELTVDLGGPYRKGSVFCATYTFIADHVLTWLNYGDETNPRHRVLMEGHARKGS